MNGKLLRPLVTIACVSMLAACGGGSGNGGAGNGAGGGSGGDEQTTLSLADHWQRFQDGNPTLRMNSSQIERAYRATDRAASHDLSLTWSFSPCEPGTDDCGAAGIDVEVDPHEYDEADLPPGTVFSPVLEHNGVRIAEWKGRTREIVENDVETVTELWDFVGYGGWLDHTIFGVVSLRTCEVGAAGCSGTSPVYEWGGAWGLTPYGVYPGTTPTGMGSATWTGVMVGMEAPDFGGDDLVAAKVWANEGPPDVYLGDARIEIDDLSDPEVDVSFTNIHNVTAGTRHRDIGWEGVFIENGLFGRGESDEYIAGMFTGPRHQEVGGEFRSDGIEGGFGAKRR